MQSFLHQGIVPWLGDRGNCRDICTKYYRISIDIKIKGQIIPLPIIRFRPHSNLAFVSMISY